MVADAEPYDPEEARGNGSRIPPEARQAAANAVGGMSLFLGVLAEIGTEVMLEVQRRGERADGIAAVDRALDPKGDGADEFRAAIAGLCSYVEERVLDGIDDMLPDDEPAERRPKRPAREKAPKGGRKRG